MNPAPIIIFAENLGCYILIIGALNFRTSITLLYIQHTTQSIDFHLLSAWLVQCTVLPYIINIDLLLQNYSEILPLCLRYKSFSKNQDQRYRVFPNGLTYFVNPDCQQGLSVGLKCILNVKNKSAYVKNMYMPHQVYQTITKDPVHTLGQSVLWAITTSLKPKSHCNF